MYVEKQEKNLDLSVVMPCLNEEKTVGISVDEAMIFITDNNINGEVIVVDNGSTDNSALVAKDHGARVITENARGYGKAIRTGIAASKGTVIIIGDCDTTYDFAKLDVLYSQLYSKECDMIIGNRYAGGIDKNEMSLSHRLGARFLSWCGRIKFHTDVYDFHCGLRGITGESAKKLSFTTDGMEFATEMIAEASRNHMTIKQVPVKLRECKFERESKLRTVQDGIRHLTYIIKSKGIKE